MCSTSCRIGLLWYHTIIRPFFALDGEQEDAGSSEATRLLDEALAMYPSSALFLYFRYMYVRVLITLFVNTDFCITCVVYNNSGVFSLLKCCVFEW